MITERHIHRYLGRPVFCHTQFGTFQGVIVGFTKYHVILGIARTPYYAPASVEPSDRQYAGWPGGPPPPPSGWQLAIPLAAILGVTALGLHWW